MLLRSGAQKKKNLTEEAAAAALFFYEAPNKAEYSHSGTEKEIHDSLFLLLGQGKKVQCTGEDPAFHFFLCSGCAK